MPHLQLRAGVPAHLLAPAAALTCTNRLSPNTSGAWLTPRYKMQSWQVLMVTQRVAAMTCE